MAAVTSRKGTYKEEATDQKDYSDAAQFFQLQSCQKILLGDSPAISLATSTPSPKPSNTPTVKPDPITSSDQFKESAPLAQDVIKDSIFGRAFIDGLNYWHIPLTNVGGDKVPSLTSVQFRMIGYPDAGWMDVPYKLKTESSFGTVYAEVDDILFSMIFKQIKYCPEFRIVREVGGKIVQIWEKGKPECSTDYNP
jgi:hypothetical protein